MPTPDFQSLMLPLLQLTADGKEHTLSEAVEKLAEQFSLTAEDRAELLPSGRQSRLANRAAWASTYLRKALLLESRGRGRFVIAERGRKVLQNPPKRITIQFLSQFPEFIVFRERESESEETGVAEVLQPTTQTPEELLESTYVQIRRNLATELLDRVKGCSPAFFERLVIDLLVAMGYGGSRKDAGEAIGRSGDGGIDGIIKEDRLGLDVLYIQAKRWEAPVGRPTVQTFAGSLDGVRAKKGVLITTSQFTKDAREYVERIDKKIVLIDGERLAQHLMDYGVGTTEQSQFVIKRIDNDYFSEE